MLWMVMATILIFILAILLWIRGRQEREWRREMAYFNRHNRPQEEHHDVPEIYQEVYGADPNISNSRQEQKNADNGQAVYERTMEKLKDVSPKRYQRLANLKQDYAFHQPEKEQDDVVGLPIFESLQETVFQEVEQESVGVTQFIDLAEVKPQEETLEIISLEDTQRVPRESLEHLLQASSNVEEPSPYAHPAADLPVITLSDAGRSLFTKRSRSQTNEQLAVIDFDDPAVARVRDKGEVKKVSRAEVQTEKTVNKEVEQGGQQSDTIGEDEIRKNLLRQRLARSRNHAVSQSEGLSNPVIQEKEVIANLAKNEQTSQRRLRRVSTALQSSVLPSGARIDDAHASRILAHSLSRSDSAISNLFDLHPKQNKTKTAENSQRQSSLNFTDSDEQETECVAVHQEAVTYPRIEEPSPYATVVEPPVVPATPKLSVNIAPPVTFPRETLTVPSAPEWQDKHENVFSSFSSQEHNHFDYEGEMPQNWAETFQQHNEQDEMGGQTASDAYKDDDEDNQEQEYIEHHELSHEENSYPLPDLSLLLPASYNPEATQSEETLLENSITIEEKLAEFKVKVKVMDAYAGPVITRYEIEPDTGVRGSSVLNLEKDLARSLGVTSIRVVETIPGKTCMGLELPNPKRQMIRLSEIFSAPVFQESKSKLTLALGQDITGQPVVTDLAKAPHLLVAGTTGSGKSVGVNAMILSMLFKATPEDVRMIMIDPKMLELSIYEGIPHLLSPVVTDMKLAANALNWCVNEMEKRYRLMSHLGVRNLAGYNQKIKEASHQGERIANPFSLTPEQPEPLEKLPFIVVVVDEFADLMMVAGKQIEQLIARIAQKARAAGIHLILATQRPSVDVITGLIKANIPTRIAFQVSSKIDSRTILDQMGAENLLGQGDMLFLPPGTGYPQRVHGAFASDDEVHQVVEYLKQFGEPDYVDILTAGVDGDDIFSNSNESRHNDGDQDPLYDEAIACVLRTQKASISSIQRYLKIGYNRAANLVEQMEADGILSAADHSGKRTILARNNSHLDE